MTREEERNLLRGDCYKLIERCRLQGRSDCWHENGVVVATSGCFDILHAGHVRFFWEVARLGGCLVVCVNSDDSVRRLKGRSRPIVPLPDRLEVLSALEPVDHLVVFEDDTPEGVIEVIRPNIWVKGGDYHQKDLVEAPTVLKYGGVVQILPYHPGHSTTSLWGKLDGSGRHYDT